VSRKRPYTGTKDGAAKGKRPGTELFQRLLCQRFRSTNLGTWVVRDVRGKPGILSVHATGRAGDTLPKSRKSALELIAFLEHYAELFEVEEIHDYLFDIDGAGPAVGYGRGWRVGRGWKVWTKTDNGGPGGLWIHWEISPRMADDPKLVRAAWDRMKKISGS